MRQIRHARLRAGLTQEELARRSGISQPALARIERGHAVPRWDTVVRLLAECGLSPEPLPLAGCGVDRSTIRRMLALSPAQRLELARTEAANLARLRPRPRR